ncbi:MAG TPA: MFS transporter [Streptosporangiaceae bacterium]|nr:MFS transporter [Streptosporangiaceae bacterium]
MTALGARRWWVLGALVVTLLAVSLDLTALNVALPTLSTALRAGTGDLQWIVAGYTLASATLLLPAGLLGDRYGRKKILLGGLVIFLAGSVWALYVSGPGGLIAARTLMGVGAAVLLPLALSVMLVVFPPEERAKAMAAWAAASFLGLPLGPIVAGYLLDHYWWGSIFLINIPVAIVALVACVALVPESRSQAARRTDIVGLLLSTGGLLALVYGVIDQPQRGWGDVRVWGSMLAGAAALAAFVAWSRRVSVPLIDLELFRDRRFVGGLVPSTVASFALFGVLFAVPQYFQGVLDSRPLGTGLRLLPMIGGLMLAARLSARLVERLGDRVLIVGGTLVLVAGALAGAATSAGDGYAYAAAWLVVVGLGMGLMLPPAMTVAIGALSADRGGAGSALIMTIRLVGGALGSAVLGSLLSAGYRGHVAVAGLPDPAAKAVRQGLGGGVAVAERLGDPALLGSVRAAFVHGMDLVLVTGAGLLLVTAIITVALLPGRAAEGGAAARATEGAGESAHEHLSG